MRRATLVPFRLLLVASALLGGRRVSGEGVAIDSVNAPFEQVLERARALPAARLVIVEFFTRRCGLCRALERETFGSRDVGAALANDLSVRYDAEAEVGRPIAERFRVRQYPTTLFLDSSGDEVDRIIGFSSPGRFVEELARIRSGIGTLRGLRAAHAANPGDASVAVALGRRLARAGDADAARELLEPVADATKPDAAARPAALLGLAELAVRIGDSRKAFQRLDRLAAEYPDAAEASDAWVLRVDLHVRDGSYDRALEAAAAARASVADAARLALLEEAVASIERRRLEATILRWGERAEAAGDVESLLRAARTALDRRLATGSALRWAEAAVKAVPDDAGYLEVEAGLLFEAGRPERAITVARAALGLARDADDRLRISRQLAAWRAASDPRAGASVPDGAPDALPVPSPPLTIPTTPTADGVAPATPDCPPRTDPPDRNSDCR